MLGGLGLQLVASRDHGNEHGVHEEHIFHGAFRVDLANGFDKGEAFDVADGAADFGDDHIGAGFFAGAVDGVFDFVGDVGDDLHGGAVVVAAAFFFNDAGVDFSRGDGGGFGELFVDKALVVAQVQVRFRPVGGDEHFPVLVGAHGAGIHIEVGIEFLHKHAEAAIF